jgi:hypothetical protein
MSNFQQNQTPNNFRKHKIQVTPNSTIPTTQYEPVIAI